MFIFLSLLNFALFLLSLAGGSARAYYPSLHDSRWEDVIAVYSIGFALTWPLTLLAGIMQAIMVSGRKPKGERSMYCLKCSYILQGLAEPRCPECGQPFDPDDVLTFRRYLKDPRDWQTSAAWAWVVISGIVIGWHFLRMLKFLFP